MRGVARGMENRPFRPDAAAGELLEEYADLIYKLAFSRMKNAADAEDVFQEVFLRYFSKRPVFDSEEHRKAWLIRVTLNCCNKLFASAWRRHRASLDEAMESAGDEPRCQDESGVLAAMDKLPPAYRIVVHLFYYEDLSIRQISMALRKKEGTIKSQLNRARAMLKEELGEGFDV